MAIYVRIEGADSEILAQGIYPFKFGELLDDQLDAATVTVFSRDPYYSPGRRVSVQFDSGDLGTIFAYAIAQDNPAEYPAGSGIFKHELSLIELTKEGEGIICPSLTFTNTKEASYLKQGSAEVPSNSITVIGSDGTVVDDPFNNVSPALPNVPLIKLPLLPAGLSVGDTVPEPDVVAQEFLFTMRKAGFTGYQRITEAWGSISSVVPSTTSVKDIAYVLLDVPGEGIIRFYESAINTNAIFDPKAQVDNFTVTYTVKLRGDGLNQNIGYDYLIPITFNQVEKYKPLARYSITDAVNRVLQLAEPLADGESPRYSFDPDQAVKYSTVYAPEFTMTQSTLREQLKVIGAFIHAEPYLTPDDVWHYLEYGQTTPATMPASTPLISRTGSYDINQYCTDVRSNVQNLVSAMSYMDAATAEPGYNLLRSIRSETQYGRINDETGYLPTDQSIYRVKRLKMQIIGDTGYAPWGASYDVNITKYLYEETDYFSKLQTFGFRQDSRCLAIYYTLGQPGIKGLFYREEDAVSTAVFSSYAIANIYALETGISREQVNNYIVAHPDRIAFNIEYEPISNLFMSHGKPFYDPSLPRYSQIYNQSENMVESEYFGENIKGVAARLGNVEETRTYITNLDKYLHEFPKLGYKLDGYSISAINVEVFPLYVKVMFGLSKDFEKISEYVGINSVKRMYEISERQVSNRDILVKEICLISGQYPLAETAGFFNSSAISREILYALDESQGYNPAIFAEVTYYDIHQAEISSVLVPVIGRAIGNVLHYSFAMKDNYSAGVTTFDVNEDGVSGRFTTDVPYTDNYGRAYYVRCRLVRRITANFNKYASAYALPDILKPGGNPPTLEYFNEFAPFYILRKDSRERISFNFELEFKSDMDDIIIGSEFAASARMISSAKDIEIGIAPNGINSADQIYQGTLNEGVSYSIDTLLRRFLISKSASDLSPNAMWVIRTTVNPATRTVVTEAGEEIQEDVTTGGKVLLAGKFVGFTSNKRNIYIHFIK